MKRTVLLSSVVGSITLLMGSALPSIALPLSPGDRIKVSIPEGDPFNGIYEVNLDGTLHLPYLDAFSVAGLEPPQIEQTLTKTLVDKKLFNPKFVRTTVQVVQWAPIQVNVSGATFQPGRVLINERKTDKGDRESQPVTGDYPPDRFLTAAIRSAGGVLPNADIKNVKLVRRGKEQIIDLTGIVQGETTDDIPLMAGDRIIVGDSGKFNNELVRPTQVTPAGVRVFISNLTQPGGGSSGQDGASFAYGSRFSQVVIAGNCAGGNSTNAKRRAVLVRTDRLNGQTQVVDRPVEDLLRKPGDDASNPFLMPDDGVACYDSKTTNLKGVAETLGSIFNPFSLLLNLFKR